MTDKKAIITNENGFSIISVVIAASLLSGVALGVSTLLTNSIKSVNYMEDKLSVSNLQSELIMNFRDNRACKNTLQGLALASSQDISNIKGTNNSVLFKLKDSYDNIKIDKIELHNVSTSTSPDSIGRMDLKVDISRTRSGIENLRSITIPLSVATDASSEIESCISFDADNGEEVANRCSVSPSSYHANNIQHFSYDSGSGTKLKYVPRCQELSGSVCSISEGTVHAITEGSSGSEYGHSTVSYVCMRGRWLALK